jgi:hypothetical protein
MSSDEPIEREETRDRPSTDISGLPVKTIRNQNFKDKVDLTLNNFPCDYFRWVSHEHLVLDKDGRFCLYECEVFVYEGVRVRACAWYVVCEYVELVRAIVRCILQRASKTTQLSEQGGCWERLPLTFQPIPPFTMISEWWRKIPLPMDSVADCNKLKLDYKPYIIHDAQHHAYLSSLLPFCTPLRNSLLDPYSLSIKTSACGCASDDNHRRHHYRQRHHPRVLFSVADQTHGTPDL